MMTKVEPKAVGYVENKNKIFTKQGITFDVAVTFYIN